MSKPALELIHAIVHGIDQALVLLQTGCAHARVGAVARTEHPLEKHARIVFGHQRQGRRQPRERAAMGATVAQIAGTEQTVFVGGHLQRGKLRFAFESFRDNLVHGDGIFKAGVRLPDMDAGKVRTASARMVAAAVAERFGLVAKQACDDDQFVLERLKSFQGW